MQAVITQIRKDMEWDAPKYVRVVAELVGNGFEVAG
jgi:hypothetical protein